MNSLRYKILIFLFFASLIHSQSYNFKRLGDETVEFIKSPLNWNGNDFLKFGLITSAGLGMFFIDEDVKQFSQTKIPSEFYIPSEIGRIWGEPYFSACLSAVFLIHASVVKNEANKKLGFEIAQTFAYSILTIGVIKISLGRERPRISDDAWNFNPFNSFEDNYFSMPSGHNALAFSLSSVLSNSFQSDVMKVLSFVPAAFTFFSRIYQNHHWISDAFIGGAIGYFIGQFVVNLHKFDDNSQKLVPENTPLFSINFAL
ncbi:MAG: phosphatase PAP2 family protein [Melioribacteraceae bacterium]|nr:phosphatase PAP2 family protein [Melioribacteraceae bacterium]MDD3558526.1 phosphatase PAP2 family protein [Melioribacteraceae bacterium]